ncbi:MAG: hypothetical protein KBS57_05990 [Alistipes sp.]|nr:hypothetical protein [Candidatus Minthomonas equi]
MKRIIAISTVILFCLSLYGQNKGAGCSSPAKTGNARPGFEQIESMKVAFFTKELDLSPEEASAFWPVYNQFSKELKEKTHATRSALRAMEDASKNGGRSDVEYKKMVDTYLDAKIKENELIKLYSSEFYKVLSPEKVNRMFLAEENFRFKMIEMWRSYKHQEHHSTSK